MFTINSVGDFVLFIGKVFIVIITVFAGTELLRQKEGVHHMWVPLTLAAIFAYLIAHCFITVYEVCQNKILFSTYTTAINLVFSNNFIPYIDYYRYDIFMLL